MRCTCKSVIFIIFIALGFCFYTTNVVNIQGNEQELFLKELGQYNDGGQFVNFQILEDIAYISRGIELGFNSKFTSEKPFTQDSVPLIAGRNIQKFGLIGEKRYIEFDSNQNK